jgi:hypothetical protein
VRWVELIVFGSLAVLGLATVWIIFRAVTGKGAWWALKGLLIVVLLVGLVFGGVYSWFHYMEMVPEHITPELVREAHAPLLDAMRRLAGEKDLEEQVRTRSLDGWQEVQEAFQEYGKSPDLLLAEIIFRSGRGLTLYWQPGQKGGQLYLERNLPAVDSPPRVSRGIVGVGQWSIIHTVDYSEPAKDRSGNAVRLRLTLRPDGFEKG